MFYVFQVFKSVVVSDAIFVISFPFFASQAHKSRQYKTMHFTHVLPLAGAAKSYSKVSTTIFTGRKNMADLRSHAAGNTANSAEAGDFVERFKIRNWLPYFMLLGHV